MIPTSMAPEIIFNLLASGGVGAALVFLFRRWMNDLEEKAEEAGRRAESMETRLRDVEQRQACWNGHGPYMPEKQVTLLFNQLLGSVEELKALIPAGTAETRAALTLLQKRVDQNSEDISRLRGQVGELTRAAMVVFNAEEDGE